jgi:hypothetical protein
MDMEQLRPVAQVWHTLYWSALFCQEKIATTTETSLRWLPVDITHQGPDTSRKIVDQPNDRLMITVLSTTQVQNVLLATGF